jgi:spore coat polysaccharide biosynthesis protein SpsF
VTTSAGDDDARSAAEVARLEALWAGEFGDQYVERNRRAGDNRGPFWSSILDRTGARSILEVGCNVGGNLRWLVAPGRRVVGVDVNAGALVTLAAEVPGAEGIRAPARALPFENGEFELTFTMGVLIHQPEESLGTVMDELVRCSWRWVLVGEYHAEQTEEVAYRGVDGALFRRDYGALFLERFGVLRVAAEGFLGTKDGWDDVSWWLFERVDE